MTKSALNLTRVGGMALLLAAAACGKKNDTGDTGATSTASAPAQPALEVSDVKLGRKIGADRRVTDETDDFSPKDVIYAVVETKGADPNATLAARWTYQDGQVVDSSSRALSATGNETTEFHITKPSGWPKGKYKVEISLNGRSAETKDFEVK